MWYVVCNVECITHHASYIICHEILNSLHNYSIIRIRYVKQYKYEITCQIYKNTYKTLRFITFHYKLNIPELLFIYNKNQFLLFLVQTEFQDYTTTQYIHSGKEQGNIEILYLCIRRDSQIFKYLYLKIYTITSVIYIECSFLF